MEKQLPGKIDDTKNLSFIQKSAEDLLITNIFLSPSNEEVKKELVIKRYKFKGTGTYLQVLLLLERLGQSEILLNIKDVSFTKSRTQVRGRYQLVDSDIVVEAYRYNSNFSKEFKIERLKKQFQEIKEGRAIERNKKKKDNSGELKKT